MKRTESMSVKSSGMQVNVRHACLHALHVNDVNVKCDIQKNKSYHRMFTVEPSEIK